jgi:hypothetical protein
MEKDLQLITDMMFKNNRLKKLLFHNTKNALEERNLTPEETAALFGKNIKIVPKLYIDGSVLSYIIISFDNFTPNATNPEFRDNVISFDGSMTYDDESSTENSIPSIIIFIVLSPYNIKVIIIV